MDFDFPEMDGDDSKDVRAKSPNGNNNGGGGFSFHGFNLEHYQPGNREYYPIGIAFFWLILISASLFQAYLNNHLMGFNPVSFVTSFAVSFVGILLYLTAYVLVDRYLLLNPVNLRYSMGKFGWWGVYSLIFGALAMVYDLFLSVTSKSGASSFSIWLLLHANVYQGLLTIFYWWIILTPLLIFLFQRRFAMMGRIIGGLGYGVMLLIIWGIVSLGNVFFSDTAAQMKVAANTPTVSQTVAYGVIDSTRFHPTDAKQYHQPFGVKHFVDRSDLFDTAYLSIHYVGGNSTDKKQAIGICQYLADSHFVSQAKLQNDLIKLGFDPQTAQQATNEAGINYEENAALYVHHYLKINPVKNVNDRKTTVDNLLNNLTLLQFDNQSLGGSLTALKAAQ